MSKPMSYLEAFLSDDAKRGRVWTDGTENFKRDEHQLLCRDASTRDERRPWVRLYAQVAVMEGTVAWADEPKTLTPQEALRALADGKVIISDEDLVVKLDDADGHLVWREVDDDRWSCSGNVNLRGFVVMPDPSQPAESQQKRPAMKAVCDGCTKRWALPSVPPCKDCEALNKPAEPQVSTCEKCGVK